MTPDRQLWRLLGLRPDDRVLVAFADRPADRVEMIPAPAVSGDSGAAAALAFWVNGEGDEARVTRRVMDIARADGRAIRWWQVREWCRANGMNELGPSYDGPADSIPLEMVARHEQEGHTMLVRRSDRGPWIETTGAVEQGVEFHGSVPEGFITPSEVKE